MNSRPPLNGGVPAAGPWPADWSIWLGQVFDCLPWKKSFNYAFAIDFPSVPANSQSAAVTKTIPGARQGDAVQVTPLVDTPGLIYKGVVTAADTVSVFACNFTAGAINPASTDFRVIVIQN